jgi:hypothetical protein
MKKLIYFLISTFLFCNGAYAQMRIFPVSELTATPTITNFVKNKDAVYLKKDSCLYTWENVWKYMPLKAANKGEKGDQGNPGRDGRDGTNGLNGTNGSQGLQGVKGDKGDTGPQGPQGIPGTVGGGEPIYNSMLDLLRSTNFVQSKTKSFISGYNLGGGEYEPVQGLTPDYCFVFRSIANTSWCWRKLQYVSYVDPVQCGVIDENKTIGNYFTTTEAGFLFAPKTGLSTNTWINVAAFNSIFRYMENGRTTTLMCGSMKMPINDSIALPDKSNYFGYNGCMYISLKGAQVNLYGSNGYTALYRPMATSVSDGLNKIGTKYIIEHIYINDLSGVKNKTGIQINSTFNSQINDYEANSLKRQLNLIFALNTSTDHGMKTGCIEGIYRGYLASSLGGTWYNSNSNCGIDNNYRSFNGTDGSWDFYNDGTDGHQVNNHTSEGKTCLARGTYIYSGASGANTVSKSIFINGVHDEHENGMQSYLFLDQPRGGVFTIVNYFSQYKGYVVDAVSAYGWTKIVLDGVLYTVAAADGKIFKGAQGPNGGGLDWQIKNIGDKTSLKGEAMSAYFAGTVPLWCPDGGCGWMIAEGRQGVPTGAAVQIPKWNPITHKVEMTTFIDYTPEALGDTLNAFHE